MTFIIFNSDSNIFIYFLQTPYYWPSNIFDPENTDYGKNVKHEYVVYFIRNNSF